MEPRHKKIVQITIDGKGPYTLHLELESVLPDDTLALFLVRILSRAIQGRPCESLGVHWDQEYLRESDALIRQIVGQFNGVWGPTAIRRPARGRTARNRTTRAIASAMPSTDHK